MNIRIATDLADGVRDPDSMTRLDALDRLNVADLEYVLGDWHGWLVMKTVTSDRDETCVVFDTEFTIHQYGWLVRHHRPQAHLRSWLVACRRRQSSSVNEWLLVPAPATVRFLQGCPTYSEACHFDGAHVCLNLKNVLTLLRS